LGVLQRLGDSPELRQLISALTPKVLACRGKIELNAFRNSMYGLKGVGSSSKEVQEFLIALDPLMELHLLELPHDRTCYFGSITHEW